MAKETQSAKNESRERLLDMLSTAIGSVIREYILDPEIIEIMVNPDGKLWIEKSGQGVFDTGYKTNPASIQQVIYLISDITKTQCNKENPILSAELPLDGSRFQGMMPPVVSSPMFSIRSRALKVYTLDDYRTQNVITPEQQETIIKAVNDKKNILVVGGTGSGKTTFVNAVLHEISKTQDRIIIIEDTLELQCASENKVYLRSQKHITMDDLLRATLRLRPDRIVVGEVRGPEALTLIKAWNTGHPGGCATIHATTARGGLIKLEQYIAEKAIPQKEMIAEAVNILVFIERFNLGRRVRNILSVEGYENDYILKEEG